MIVTGVALLLWHVAVQGDCTYEVWCGNPNQGVVGTVLFMLGVVFLLK